MAAPNGDEPNGSVQAEQPGTADGSAPAAPGASPSAGKPAGKPADELLCTICGLKACWLPREPAASAPSG